jgi:sigma-E factor negative regulatory protein RseC
MGKLLEHRGVVSAVGEKLVEVEFSTEETCPGCKAEELCGKDETGTRFVTVYEPLAQYYVVGEDVTVVVSEVMGMKGATCAYIIPFFILLGSLLLTLHLGWGKTEASFTSLGVMALWYAALRLFFRRHLEKEIVFKVRKI